jgi:hypothetical protein
MTKSLPQEIHSYEEREDERVGIPWVTTSLGLIGLVGVLSCSVILSEPGSVNGYMSAMKKYFRDEREYHRFIYKSSAEDHEHMMRARSPGK